MITTVIPVLNGEKWIAKAVESFVEQIVKKELIIVDSSLNNKTKNVVLPYLKRYNDEISYYHREDLAGIFDKCNFGLEIARGDVFHTMACDHRLVSGTYELVEKEIQNVDWLFGNVALLNENEVELKKNIYPLFNLLEYRQVNILAGCACYTKIEFIKKHKLKFNQKFSLNGDYDFYLRLANLSQPKQIQNHVIKLVIRRDGLTDFGNNQEIRKQDKIEIIQNIKKEFPLPDYLESERKQRLKVLIAVCNEGWIRSEVTNTLIMMAMDPRVDKKIIYSNHRPYENNLSHIANKF